MSRIIHEFDPSKTTDIDVFKLADGHSQVIMEAGDG